MAAPGRALIGGVGLALALACGVDRPEPWGEGGLALADFVVHQRSHVSTDLVSIPEGVGLGHLERGWQLDAAGTEEGPCAVIAENEARLTLFSADGDLEALALDLSLAGDAPGRRNVKVLLNDRQVGRLRLGLGWSTHRLPVPAPQVRTGINVLTLVPGMGRAGRQGRPRPSVRLRRLRFVSRTRRPLWSERPESIRVQHPAPRKPGPVVVEMPTASFLDLFLRVPGGGRLVGALSLAPPPARTAGAVDVSVRLLDERRAETRLLHQTLSQASGSPRRLALDLAPWSGQLVRLRFGVSGPGNGVVRWQGVGVQGEAPVAEPAPGGPIDRARVTPSGLLGRPDVLVVLLDAARADAFSAFGGPHETPAVDRLAAEGTVFHEALAPSSWTGQSVPAMLTGLFPDTLGIGAFGSAFTDAVPTLAELAAAAGYRTVLWSQHNVYELQRGLPRGFEESYRTPSTRDWEVLPKAQDLLSDAQPTLAFVHLLPPHQPYTPPAPFLGAYSSWHEGGLPVRGADLRRLTRRPRPPSEEEVRYARDRYLEHAAYADHLLSRVLLLLDGQGRYRESLVVLTSDHGEAFHEHGRFLHGQDVHREALRVPLVVKWPASVKGHLREVTQQVSLVDLVPTLVDGLSLGGESGFQGRSLLPLCFEGVSRERPVYAMTRGSHLKGSPARPQLMLDSGGWRVLYRPWTDTVQLYRVDSDPQERLDLARELPLRARLMRQGVLAQSAWNRGLLKGGASGADELDLEDREQLRALGYLN